MKIAMKISVWLNLMVLAGSISFVMTKHKASPAPIISDATPGSSAVKIEIPPDLRSTNPPPFRWSQLDADDYHVYVKNLRTIGCPEPTVRAIVSADVDSVYQNYRRDLDRKLAGLENSSWPAQLEAFNSEQKLKDEIQRIPAEEAAKIADLLGQKPVAIATLSPSIKPVAVPLVLQEVDLSALNLNESQKQLIASLRQDFIQQIGGLNQNPEDPDYLMRWQKAQPEMDDILKGMIGTSAFENYQLLAADSHIEATPQP